MIATSRSPWVCAIAMASALLFGARHASAQTVTTGNLSGTVVDAQGGVLPGATVVAIHEPTGTRYEAVTGPEGRYNILNVRVGPYTIIGSLSGFAEEKIEHVNIALGETKTGDLKLQIAGLTEVIQVKGAAPELDTARAGTAENISNAVKEQLPTINRAIVDIVRISPMFSSQGSGDGAGASVVSVAGTSFRYNSLQIDGAANNDLFGLAGSAGAPGGAAETQPVSLDAIAEIQLVVSPYDVRQGGFAGGGINAITKTGSNDIHGTAFYFGRNQDWVGDGVTGKPISTFSDKQGGFSLGGPIMKNRAFYFGTLDDARKVRPTGYSVHAGGQAFAQPALFDQFVSDLKRLYGYDVGPNAGGEFSKQTNSNKYFVRGDFNVATGHQLTVRNNYIDALNDIGYPSQTFFYTPDNFYRYISKTNSTVAQLNSQFGMAVNELRLTYTRVRDHRENPVGAAPFPQVRVTVAPNVDVRSGTEQYSARNAIDQDIIELNDALTMLKGNHTLTIGTHNEFLDLSNLFIRDNFGYYQFSSLANFEAGLAQAYDHSFSATTDPQQRAAFTVRQYGLYAGDQWRAAPNFTLTYGVRMDAPRFPNKPRANPISVQYFGYATDVVPNQVEWSPRVGFNYDLGGAGKRQVRGGIGMFTGRPAYVWISNQFGNTGLDFTRIGASFNTANTIPFVTDALNQPTTVTGAKAGSYANEIDVIDPNFKYPSILRGNIGYDTELPWGFIGNGDIVWSKTLKDIKYQNLNFSAVPGAAGVGGRPFFTRNVGTLSDVILLENTTEGYSWNIAYTVRRPFTNGLFIEGSYSYGRAKSIMDGTSDQAASNWGNVYVPGDPNNAPLTISNYDPGSRINLTVAYEMPFAKIVRPVVSVFYSGQSGRPYALTYNRDVNGDNRGSNDLVYVPNANDNIAFVGGTYQDFMNWLGGDPCLTDYVGQIMPRNACRGPWTNTLDARFAIQVPVKKVKAEVTLDALNLINLFNSDKGLVQYQSYGQLQQPQPIPTSVTLAAPLTGYNVSTMLAPTYQRFLIDDLRSRWQLQLGARFRF